MPYRYNKLRGRIVEKYGSIKAFQEHLENSPVTVSKKLNGKLGFSQTDIIKWGELLDIKKEEYGIFFFS